MDENTVKNRPVHLQSIDLSGARIIQSREKTIFLTNGVGSIGQLYEKKKKP